MQNKMPNTQLDALFDAILTLRDREGCYAFFEDLCTIGELHAMGQRFHVADLLHRGSVYADIVAETGASTATVSRVNRALLYGAGGYRKVLEDSAR